MILNKSVLKNNKINTKKKKREMCGGETRVVTICYLQRKARQ